MKKGGASDDATILNTM